MLGIGIATTGSAFGAGLAFFRFQLNGLGGRVDGDHESVTKLEGRVGRIEGDQALSDAEATRMHERMAKVESWSEGFKDNLSAMGAYYSRDQRRAARGSRSA